MVDEAYVELRRRRRRSALIAEHPNVIVLRTLSKGYSLAGLRLGYLIARPEIVDGLIKVKDSYNCDTLSLVGGTAALEDREYLAETTAKIRATRRRLTGAMRDLGYRVPESHANFAWCTGGPPAPGDLRGPEGPQDPGPADALSRAIPTDSGSPWGPIRRSTDSSKPSRADRRSPFGRNASSPGATLPGITELWIFCRRGATEIAVFATLA